MSDDLAAFMAGFIEGEASFSIRKQRANGPYGCAFGLTVRRDDLQLLTELATGTRLGTITRQVAREGSQPQATWNVGAKSDCLRLCDLLDRFPLRGRKSLDYAIWKAALQWWVAGDPTITLVNRDWTPMAYMKERLEEGRRYTGDEDSIQDQHRGLTFDWPWFLSGFFTAEGWLGIHTNAPRVLQPRLAVRLRQDDRPLLAELRGRTNAGRVYSGPCSNGLPVAQWIVCSRDDLMHLVTVFDQHPPKGRKMREYEIWRDAVQLYSRVRPARSVYDRLHRLRLALKEARAYRPADAVPVTGLT